MAEALLDNINVYDGSQDVALVVREASENSYRMEANQIDSSLPAVVSVWAKGESTVPLVISAFGEVFTKTVTTNWQRLEMIVDAPLSELDEENNEHFYIYISPLTDGTFYLYKGMVESNANHASDWIPAIEDSDEAIQDDFLERDNRIDELYGTTSSAMQILKRVITGGYDAIFTSESTSISTSSDPAYIELPQSSHMEAGCVFTVSMASAVFTPSGNDTPLGFTLECVRLIPQPIEDPENPGEEPVVVYTEETLFEHVLQYSQSFQKYTFVTADDNSEYIIRIYPGIKGGSIGGQLTLTEFILEQGTYASMWNDAIDQTRARLEEVTSSLTEDIGRLSFVTDIRTEIEGTINTVTNSFQFDAITDPQNPKLIIKTSNDKMRMELSNNRLAFVMGAAGSEPVAYFSSEKLYVKQLEGSQSLSIGTSDYGYLDIVSTSTGVGFVWR